MIKKRFKCRKCGKWWAAKVEPGLKLPLCCPYCGTRRNISPVKPTDRKTP